MSEMPTGRLLIVSHDVIGERMAGPGIRYWEIARTLAAERPVRLIEPQPIDLVPPPNMSCGSFVWGESASLAAETAQAEVLLINSYLLDVHPELTASPQPLIIDLYDPTLLENLEQGAASLAQRSERNRRDVALLARALAAGDLFLCATERQRDLYLGALMLSGRITPAAVADDPLLRRLIAVLPFGLPALPPVRQAPLVRGVIAGIGPDDPLAVWGGGLWDWLDPQTVVRAMPQVIERVPQARLLFLAGRHPGLNVIPAAARESRQLAEELGLLDRHIFFYEEWLPYERRADVLLDADVLVSLHRAHLETAYAAVRSRFLDHLWAGRASLVSDGDAAAALVRESGAGRVVPIDAIDATAAALAELLADHEARAAAAAAAKILGERFRWPTIVAPLREFLAAPRKQASPPDLSLSAPSGAALTPLMAQRNQAIGLAEQHWSLSANGGDLLDRLGGRLSRLLLASQREFNAAQLRVDYAVASELDHLASQTSGQFRAFAEQLSGIEEALLRLEARLDERPVPPPQSREEGRS